MSPQGMPNPSELYESAAQGFRETLAGVTESQLNNSTPCSDWTVQALMNHNIKVARFAHGTLLESNTVDPFAVNEPLPTEGALAAFDTSISRVLDLVKQPGFLDVEIDSPFGRITRAQFLMNPFMDLLLHRWDLAKGTSQDTTLDSSLVEVAHAASASDRLAAGRSRGFIGAEVSVSESASLQDRLVGLWGRQP